MPVLSAKNLSKAFGPRVLFDDVTLTIVRGEKVGLLGLNGSGKSTLLKLLAGLEPADKGTIERRRDSTILYLSQEPELDPDKTPLDIVLAGLGEWREASVRHAELSARIEGEGATDALLEEQAKVGERIEQLGGWDRGHVAEDMLGRLGVRDVHRPVGTMSGGERRRVALAGILVAQPTLAILDEPTNHLDADTIEWLEMYLADEYPGAVFLVTHDRYVLDAICDRTIELDRGRVFAYEGGYAEYLDAKAERIGREEKAEDTRLNLLRRETAWLRRGAKARSTKQKARIQRAMALAKDKPPPAYASLELGAFAKAAPKLGGTILDLEDVDLEIAGRTLAAGLTLRLVHGDRIGVVGPNGAGKTTLLRAITGDLVPEHGTVTRGTKTKLSHFDQARAALKDDWSIVENVAEREGADKNGAGVVIIGDETIEMRTYLEQFLFERDKQRQKVGSLSGGERARVALAKVLAGGSNLLLLDEPTNDLDTATLAALEELLTSWPGVLVVVSHDRWFLDRVATAVLAFEDERAILYPGNYSQYRSLKAEADAARKKGASEAKAQTKSGGSKASTPPPKPAVKALSFAEKKELDGLLERVDEGETQVAALEARLADPDLYAKSPADAAMVAEDLAAAKAEVAKLIARWEGLEARRDAKK